MYPNILDFSAALPWVLTGLIVGILLSWLWRLLTRPAPEPAAPDPRELYKAEMDAFRGSNDRLKADYLHLQAALEDAERRAGAGSDLKQKFALLTSAELAARNELTSSKSAIEKMRDETQSTAARARSLEEEFGRAQDEMSRLRAAADTKDEELSRMKSDLHRVGLAMQAQSQQSADAGRYLSEIDHLKAELNQRDHLIEESKSSHSKIASELVRAREELTSTKAQLDTTNAQLSSTKAQLDQHLDQGARFAAEHRDNQDQQSEAYDKTVAELAEARSHIQSLEDELEELRAAASLETSNTDVRAPVGSAARGLSRTPRSALANSAAVRPARVLVGPSGSDNGIRKYRIRSSDVSLRSNMSEIAELRARIEALAEQTEELREIAQKVD